METSEDLRFRAAARTAIELGRHSRSTRNRTLNKALKVTERIMEDILAADLRGLPIAPLLEWLEASITLAGAVVIVTDESSKKSVN